MSGKAYLITGASRGIGAALAERLAAPGRLIAINYLSSDAAAEKVARAVEAKGAEALSLKADATTEKGVEDIFSKLPVDGLAGLVLNAGAPARHARLAETPAAEFERQWRAQAFSAALCCRRALPAMMKSRSGRIVFVLSSALEGAPPAFLSAYVSAKYALLGLARAVEAEASSRGVKVSCAFPGMTDTDFIKDFPRPIVDAAREAQGRISSPREAAESIAALVEAA